MRVEVGWIEKKMKSCSSPGLIRLLIIENILKEEICGRKIVLFLARNIATCAELICDIKATRTR